MKKLLKILAALAVLFVLAVAGLTVFIKVKFPPERIKALANEQARLRLHREIKLADVSVGLVQGLSLKGFELSERPDFSAGRFLASTSLSVKPRLFPLLKGEIEIRSIDLDKPEIRIVRAADGSFNFSDLAGSTAPASAAAPAAGIPAPGPAAAGAPAISINRLTVSGGTVSFVDRSPAQLVLAVKDLDLAVNAFSLTAPFSARLSCEIEGTAAKKPVSGRVAFEGKADLSSPGGAVVKKLDVEIGKTAFSASGSLKNFSAPEFDLTLNLKNFDAQSLAPFAALPPEAADASAAGTISLKGSLADLSVTGNLKVAAAGLKTALAFDVAVKNASAAPAFDGKVSFSDLNISKSGLAPGFDVSGPLSGEVRAKGTPEALRAEVELNGDKAAVKYGSLATKEAGAGFKVRASADLKKPFTNPSFQADGEIEKLTLAPGAPLPPELKLSGPAAVKFSAKGSARDIAVKLEFEGKDVTLGYADSLAKPAGVPFALAASASVRDQKDVRLDEARLTLASFAATVQGAIADAPGAGKLNLKVQAPAFDVAPLAALVPSLKDYKIVGKSGADMTVSGAFAAPKLQGTLSLKGLGATAMPGVEFRDLNGVLALTENTAETTDLKGKFNGSDISFKARVRNFSRPEIFLEGNLVQLDAGALMNAMSAAPASPAAPAPAGGMKQAAPAGPAAAAASPAPVAKTEGTFRVGTVVHPNYTGRQFQLTWNLTDVGPDMGQSNGVADFAAADGKVHDLPLVAKLNKLVKKDSAEFAYSKMSGHFRITRGVLDTQDFTVDGDLADVLAKGTVDLVSLASDLRLVMKLPKGAVGGSVGEYFTDEDGRPTVEATIKGPLPDPSIQIDLSRAAKRAAEDLLRKGLEKFKGGGAPDAGQPAAEPSAKDQQIDKAIEQGKKAFDKLFKKR